MSGEIPSPSTEVIDIDKEPSPSEFDPSLSEDERRFYLKAYPNIEMVRDRKLHCTTCKMHIGTAPSQEGIIKMHPVLRVTHCSKCHDFYNSGEFSKGEDGSELYCRWCGQGGEVYCCSNCPYVFCKSCIVKNLSRGVVADIEQNENWSCFNCAPKILWPLRAQHWALIKFIEKQKKLIVAKNLPESETKQLMMKDQSTCCRLAKAKCGNMSDSVESIDSLSRRSTSSASPAGQTGKKLQKIVPRSQSPAAKRAKHSNDEVVCTPDLLSMLEPDCQITVSAKQRPSQSPVVSTPKVMSIQNTSNYGGNSPMLSATAKNTPPPLVLRNTSVQMRPITPSSGGRRTVLGPRAPSTSNTSPVYHTINGYRIDLNTAAQQETFRLPNGKLIQVKRQGASNQAVAPHGQPTTPHGQPPSPAQPTQPPHGWQRNVHMQAQHSTRPVQIAPTHPNSTQQYPQITIQQHVPQQHPQMLRYQNTMVGHTTVTAMHNGPPPQIHVINGSGGTQLPHPAGSVTPQPQPPPHAPPISIVRPAMTRLIFPNTPIGQARSQLQDQVFNAMEICQHLTGKVQTLTNSNAYKQARNYLEVKELYIHLSYLLTYAIGRFKGLQDKCLADMRHLGFVNDADSLQNGQLAADKQASDDEDNEIEIVEPKTDTITLDSDNEDDESTSKSAPVSKTSSPPSPSKPDATTLKPDASTTKPDAPTTKPDPSTNNPTTETAPALTAPTPAEAITPQAAAANSNLNLQEAEFLSNAQVLLASLLEVDLSEGDQNSSQTSPSGGVGSSASGDAAQKKQPRKKTTNKPNPTLIKQKEILQRERLEEMKRNDKKLKMKCAIELKKAEEEYPFAKEMLAEGGVLEKAQDTGGGGGVAAADKKEKEEDAEEVEVLLVADFDSSLEEEKTKTNEQKEKEEEEETLSSKAPEGGGKEKCDTKTGLMEKKKENSSKKTEEEAKNDQPMDDPVIAEDNRKDYQTKETNGECKAITVVGQKMAESKEVSENITEREEDAEMVEVVSVVEASKPDTEDPDKSECKDIEMIEVLDEEEEGAEPPADSPTKISEDTKSKSAMGAQQWRIKKSTDAVGAEHGNKRTDVAQCEISPTPATEPLSPAEFLPNGEAEIDVDKEIAKLLHPKNKAVDIDINETAENVGSSSDLMYDLNELIESASDSLT